ncbi:MAG: hypothetical protein ACSLE0_12000, partial [Chitinophagaceae bacterium]
EIQLKQIVALRVLCAVFPLCPLWFCISFFLTTESTECYTESTEKYNGSEGAAGYVCILLN